MKTVIQKAIRVLLVEDDKGDADYLRWTLRELPGSAFEVEWVQRLAGGILYLETRQTDVALLDLNLPDSRGLETLDKLRAGAPQVPIVVLTGLDDEELAVAALRHGAQDYLIKGQIDNNLLSRAIRYAIGRKQVEDELLSSQEQLRRVQKMEAVGRLAGGIAHDFNNMLTSILGFARFVSTQLGEEHPAHSDVGQIIQAARRAAALTRQLLALGQNQVLRVTTFDPNRIVRDAHRLLRRTFSENIEIVTILGEQVAPIRADASQVEQVIMNLALNGRDAMPNGGILTIRTETITADEAFCRTRHGLQPGRHTLVSVKDNGIGMPADVRDRAFEPFFTTKGKDQGTGLGLATAYSVVQQFGGCIEIDSEPGVGTEVRLYFPASEESDADSTPTAYIKSPGGTETILLVEDEETIRHLTRRMLQDLGYTVLEARHGGTARAVFMSAPKPVDLVVSDVVMPHKDGPHMMQELRQIRKDLKVVYISGYTEGRLEQDGPDHLTYVLPKPFTKEELAVVVRAVLDGRPPPRASI
jgi:two-component system cell cycle sensor histidine kinase/response regulator CckA